MLSYLNDVRTTVVGLNYIEENIEIPSEDLEIFEAIKEFIKKKMVFLFFEKNRILEDSEKYIELGKELNGLRDRATSLCDSYVEKYFGDKFRLPDEASKVSFVATTMLYSGANKNIDSECHNVIMRDAMELNGMYISKYRLPFAACYSIYHTKQEIYDEFGLPALVSLEKSKSIAINSLGIKKGIQAYAVMCSEDEFRQELFALSYENFRLDKIAGVLAKTLNNRGNK